MREDDSLIAQTMAGDMSHRSSLMEGSMDTADWTAFDQQAAMSSNPDDNFSWSIVVISLHTTVCLLSLLYVSSMTAASHMTTSCDVPPCCLLSMGSSQLLLAEQFSHTISTHAWYFCPGISSVFP